MSDLRQRLSIYEQLSLYREVLKDIRDNYDCDESVGQSAQHHQTHCRACKAKMALEDKDPWGGDIETFHLDELPIGKYIAYVSGYRDEGVVGYQLVPEGTPLNLNEHIPFDKSLSIEAETDVMPRFPNTICGGDIITLEILEPSGYNVLNKLR